MNQFCFGTKEGKVCLINYSVDENNREWHGYNGNFETKAK